MLSPRLVSHTASAFHPKRPHVSRTLGAIGLSVYKYVDSNNGASENPVDR